MPLRLAAHAMGTRFELVLDADPSAGDEALLRAAGEAALEEIDLAEARWSAFRRDSLLAHVNRTAHVEPVRIDEDAFELFMVAALAHAASGGAFDPTVAPLLAAGGFRGASKRAAADVRAPVGFEHVELDREARTVRFAREGILLDLGGIAKGHALDRATAVLREAGVDRALLHGGTSAAVGLGAPPDADAWRVSIGGGAGAPVAELADACLAVSAPSGRQVEGRGHVLDPRRRDSARGVRAAAVVVALDAHPAPACLADALSTALVANGGALADESGLPDHERAWQPDDPGDRGAEPTWRSVPERGRRLRVPDPPEA